MEASPAPDACDLSTIRKDSEGRYCLNDLHKAAGGEDRIKPSNFFRLDSTEALINELLRCEHLNHEPLKIVTGKGKPQGTYVDKELVYAYAMWVSPAFHLKVIRFFDRGVTQGVAAVVSYF